MSKVKCPYRLRCTKGIDCPNEHTLQELQVFRKEYKEDQHAVNDKKKKTQLCKHHQNGTCKHSRAEECPFAHGEDDLRSDVDLAFNKQYNPANRKTVKCWHFENGSCARGDDCNFAHFEDDLARDETNTQQYNPPNRKTRLCRHFQNGNCARGNKCNFAHGEDDLYSRQERPLEDPGLSKNLAELKV